jgi:hypothetical protein
MTALGRVRVTRVYATGPDGGSFAADEALGVDGYLTTHARRLATLAGVQRSFAKAQQLLAEMCGWELDDETIRQVTHASATQAQAQRFARGDATRFGQASGTIEVPIDAGKVNTRDGWKDVKIGLICKREAGEPATPAEWDQRALPAPTIRTVVAAIEDSDQFAQRMRAEADRLDATVADAVTVLGDGAEWIWNLAAEVFPQACGVLDVYHALEHIGDAVKAVWGDGTDAAHTQRERGRQAVLASGKVGVERWLADAFAQVPDGVCVDPLLDVAAYLAKHPTRLQYAARLAAGQSIGSGQVEGAVKQLLNLRLKRTGARWCVPHVGPLVELLALCDTPEWHTFWMAA